MAEGCPPETARRGDAGNAESLVVLLGKHHHHCPARERRPQASLLRRSSLSGEEGAKEPRAPSFHGTHERRFEDKGFF